MSGVLLSFQLLDNHTRLAFGTLLPVETCGATADVTRLLSESLVFPFVCSQIHGLNAPPG
jgi:hypothetical protein